MRDDLSPTMLEAIRFAREEGGGKIERQPGGFWIAPGDNSRSKGWFGTTTIEALISRGIVEVTKRAGKAQFPVEVTLKEDPAKRPYNPTAWD